MPAWSLPAADPRPVVVSDQDLLYGPDVRFRGNYEITPDGDYRIAEGLEAVHQSVEREAMANAGELVYRPDWGMGLRGALYRPRTRSSVDELKTLAEARVRANPRVTRVRECEVREVDFGGGKTGLELDLAVEAGGRDARLPVVTVPPRNANGGT